MVAGADKVDVVADKLHDVVAEERTHEKEPVVDDKAPHIQADWDVEDKDSNEDEVVALVVHEKTSYRPPLFDRDTFPFVWNTDS